jgi:hypothetical protein
MVHYKTNRHLYYLDFWGVFLFIVSNSNPQYPVFASITRAISLRQCLRNRLLQLRHSLIHSVIHALLFHLPVLGLQRGTLGLYLFPLGFVISSISSLMLSFAGMSALH